MTTTKAKEILQDIVIYQHSAKRSDEGDAIKMGILAIRFYEAVKSSHGVTVGSVGIGETKE